MKDRDACRATGRLPPPTVVAIHNHSARRMGYIASRAPGRTLVTLVDADDVVSACNVRVCIVRDDAGELAPRGESELAADRDGESDRPEGAA